MQHAVELLQRF